MDIKEEFEKFKTVMQLREKAMLERLDKLEEAVEGLAYSIGSLQDTLAERYKMETRD